MDYFELIHQNIHHKLNLLIYGDYEDNWNNKFINWFNNSQISMINSTEWRIIILLIATVVIVALIFIIAVKFFKNSHEIPMNSIENEDTSSINEDSQSIESEYICEPLEICEIIEDNSIFNKNSENFNELYVLSLDINQSENSSLKINEIYDTNDENDICDAILINETKNIIDELINSVDLKLENFEINNEEENNNADCLPQKFGSKIPLPRKRQRGQIERIPKD